MFEPKLLALPGLVFDPEYAEDGEVWAECVFTSDFEDEKLKRTYMSNGNDEECEKDTPALQHSLEYRKGYPCDDSLFLTKKRQSARAFRDHIH